MNKKIAKICLYGNYDSRYSRNKIIVSGLKENRVDIVDCHVETKNSSDLTKSDISIQRIGERLLNKLSIIPKTIFCLDSIADVDAILVMFPGYFEVIPAFFVKLLLRKKLVFDQFDSLYETIVVNRGIIREKSIFSKIIFAYERLIYKLPDILLVHSNADKRKLSKRFSISESKIRTLYIGADDTIYRNFENKRKTNVINVCYFGLYLTLHGVDTIVKAAALLKKYREIRFYLVGQGQTYDEVRRLANKLKVHNVTFINRVGESRENMLYLEKSDVFLGVFEDSDRINQVLPNKVFQGLAMGKCVVTADTSASREILKNNTNSLLVPPGNEEALAATLLKLSRNTRLQKKLKIEARKDYVDNFTPKEIGKDLLYIIKHS